LTLPTSTNWSMSIYSGNAGTRNSTLFGSNTCLFDIDNVGGGNMTIRTYDHAMIYMGGGQAGSTNPVLTNGFACRLFYGGVNGTNIYNLNTGLFPPGGGGGSQTPWTQTINAGNFSLTNLAGISGAAGYNPTNIVLGIGAGMSTGAVWDTNGVNQSCISRMGGSIWLTNGGGSGSGSAVIFTAYFTPPFANGTAPIVIAGWGAPSSSGLGGGYGIVPVITSNSVAFECGAGMGGSPWKINWIVQAPPGQ